MNIGSAQAPLLSFEQTNPGLEGFKRGLELFQGVTKSAYLPQTIKAKLLAQQLMNQKLKAQADIMPQALNAELLGKLIENRKNQAYANLAPEAAAAELKQAQATSGLTKAQTDFAAQNARNVGIGANIKQHFAGDLMGNSIPNTSPMPMQQPSSTNIMQSQPQMNAKDYINYAHQQNPGEGQQKQYLNPNQMMGAEQPANFNHFLERPTGAANSPIGQSFVSKNDESKLRLYEHNENIERQYDRNDSTKAANDSGAAIRANQVVEGLRRSGDKLGIFEQGPVLGKFRPLTGAAQEFDSKVQQLIQNTAENFQNDTHITDATRISAALSKASREFHPLARNSLLSFQQAMNNRKLDLAQMDLDLIRQGVDKKTRELLKADYNAYRPFFNENVDGRNVHMEHTWHDFTNPIAIQAKHLNQPYVPPNQKKLEESVITPEDIANSAKNSRMSKTKAKYHLYMQGAL